MLTSLSLKSQNVLIIEIENLKSDNGKVLIELRDGDNNFIKGISVKIDENICLTRLENLKIGKYSFKYFHDENNNGKLDTNKLGIPNEGFGFSNNAKGTFGPPAFRNTIFNVNGSVVQKCTPHYF